ncbi:hypothetical protein PVAND_003595 [Polypedilum vanderplanki]|uniref:HMG box domain-containing protein n=1 Tax=Polypedilum vanderplanki TaxID=319348 RepID=A0A9J6BUI7_POLVA|nr:hypothetical protein PVAND_003595 [Polypedilum vanderplanki]
MEISLSEQCEQEQKEIKTEKINAYSSEDVNLKTEALLNQPQHTNQTADNEVKQQINTDEQVTKKKRKKSKKIKRDEKYPKYFRNAYVRYCDEVRAKVCEENPTFDPVAITKRIAANWLALDKVQKKPYLDQAQVDKDRYFREMKEYNALYKPNDDSEPPKKKVKKKGANVEKPQDIPSTSAAATAVSTNNIQSTSTSQKPPSNDSNKPITQSVNNAVNKDEIPKAFLTSNCELPIFTDAFLEHNKIIEAELKTLRKNNIEIEQQNSVLMKHIENMDNGINKVEGEIAANRQKNSQLEIYLVKLRIKLSAHFNSHSQPGWKNGATVENIDKYFQDLAVEAQKHPSSVFVSKARDILKKVDLKIL